MTIETLEDWVELAKKTIPLLPEYLDEFRPVQIDVLEDMCAELVEKEDWNELWHLFNNMYNFLPDTPGIRHRPFFDLCDLCSEYKVWEQPPLDIDEY